jgi:hypothetical protein
LKAALWVGAKELSIIDTTVGLGSEMTMPANEKQKVADLFQQLCSQPRLPFPKRRGSLIAPSKQGVYVIRNHDIVLHVGRTIRLHQRLKNHLHGSSSFTNMHLKRNGSVLRNEDYTYQYLVLEDPRERALLEAYAIGAHCPAHIGTGEKV